MKVLFAAGKQGVVQVCPVSCLSVTLMIEVENTGFLRLSHKAATYRLAGAKSQVISRTRLVCLLLRMTLTRKSNFSHATLIAKYAPHDLLINLAGIYSKLPRFTAFLAKYS